MPRHNENRGVSGNFFSMGVLSHLWQWIGGNLVNWKDVYGNIFCVLLDCSRFVSVFQWSIIDRIEPDRTNFLKYVNIRGHDLLDMVRIVMFN